MTAALERTGPRADLAEDLVTAAELAEAIGLPENEVRARAAAWTREHGFPCRLRPFGWIWSRNAIRQWMRSASSKTEEFAIETPPLTIVGEQRAALTERYGGRS